MSAKRTRHHQMTVTIMADRPITRGAAVKALRGALRGTVLESIVAEKAADCRIVKVTGVR